VTEDRPTVHLELDSSPETLTLVRGALGGIGEQLALDPELLDDLKTAVSEACNNVVMHAYEGETGPLDVDLYASSDSLVVLVSDEGRGIPAVTSTDEHLTGVGLPVIRALTQRAEFRSRPDGGTGVWMEFAASRDGRQLFKVPEPAAPGDEWSARLTGDAVVSVSPVSFVGAVLGRLARALAARARFSLDRFSDVYLVTDGVAAHAVRAANGRRISFGISTQSRRLELTIGPFREGSSLPLREEAPVRHIASALSVLSDELEVRPAEGGEMLYVVMIDHRESMPRASA
jgi:serine/threonine-protein kinase RsbW